MVPELGAIFLGTMKDQVFAFGAPVEMSILIEGPLVHARNETSFGEEVGSDVEILQIEGKPPPAADQDTFMMLAERIAGCVQSRTHVAAVLRIPILVQTENALESSDSIKRVLEFPVGVHGANAGLFADVVADASNAEVGALSMGGIGVGDNQSRRG